MDGDLDLDLLKRLSETPGIPGREAAVRDLLAQTATPLFDDTRVDPMGSLILIKHHPGRPRVLLGCHMDEIGFYVRHVDDKGFLRVQNAGGFDARNLFARRVRVETADGGFMTGLLNPAGRPVHIAKEEERKKVPEINEFFVDLCLPPEEVKARVSVGDPVTIQQSFETIGRCVTGKALDNRVAGFVAIEAMRQIRKRDLKVRYEFVLAATVQEEVGLRGAGPVAYSVEPDLCLALDTTLCVDTPGVPDDERVTKQGAGVGLKVMDGSSISDASLVRHLRELAKTREIPHQLCLLPRGGTDAGAMQRTRAGVRTATLAVPTRYIHTITECVHTDDLRAAVDLLTAFLTSDHDA